MMRPLILCFALLLSAGVAPADDAVPAPEGQQQEPKEKPQATGDKSAQAKPDGDVEMSGMSILGNDEAPKSLVIVPWKSSQLGDAPGLSKLLDDSTQPVDKELFMRELSYYRIRSESK